MTPKEFQSPPLKQHGGQSFKNKSSSKRRVPKAKSGTKLHQRIFF